MEVIKEGMEKLRGQLEQREEQVGDTQHLLSSNTSQISHVHSASQYNNNSNNNYNNNYNDNNYSFNNSLLEKNG